jgi:hypothetical protein
MWRRLGNRIKLITVAIHPLKVVIVFVKGIQWILGLDKLTLDRATATVAAITTKISFRVQLQKLMVWMALI